jgi:hypothetical protein
MNTPVALLRSALYFLRKCTPNGPAEADELYAVIRRLEELTTRKPK